MKKLLNHGYSTTTNRTFYRAGDKIAEIPVWYGRQKTVTATVAKPFAVTLTKGADTKGLRVLARYNEPVRAPVAAGEKIGTVIAQLNGVELGRADLIAQNRVSKVQFFARVWRNISVLFTGK